MVHFIGAGPGAPDLITVRGQKLLGEADITFMQVLLSIRHCWI